MHKPQKTQHHPFTFKSINTMTHILHLPYFGVVLEFPILKIIDKSETQTTLIYRAWGKETQTTVPNEWVKCKPKNQTPSFHA